MHTEIRLLLGLLVPVGGIWLFIELADEVLEGDARSVDRAVLLFFRASGDLSDALGPPWFESIYRQYGSAKSMQT